MLCKVCGGEFPLKRQELGYDTCLKCGEKAAAEEKERKSKCTAPAYNKGPYMYILTKRDAKDAGKKGGGK